MIFYGQTVWELGECAIFAWHRLFKCSGTNEMQANRIATIVQFLRGWEAICGAFIARSTSTSECCRYGLCKVRISNIYLLTHSSILPT